MKQTPQQYANSCMLELQKLMTRKNTTAMQRQQINLAVRLLKAKTKTERARLVRKIEETL